MSASRFYKNDSVSFDQILLDLQNPSYNVDTLVDLNLQQLIEYRRLFVLANIFPYATVMLPHPDDIESFNDIIPSLEKLTLEEKYLVVNFPAKHLFKFDDSIRKFDISIGNEPKSERSYKRIFHKINKLNTIASLKLIRRDKAIQMSPAYGYNANFFQIETYSSGRPVTSMNLLIPDIPIISTKDALVDDNGLINIGDSAYLPVVRYAIGSDNGLYYTDETERKFCGTFYYHEMESPLILELGHYLIFRNKYACFTLLREKLSPSDITVIFASPEEIEEYKLCNNFDIRESEDAESIDNIYRTSEFMYNFASNILGDDFDDDMSRQLMRKYFIEGQSVKYVETYSDGMSRDATLDPNTNTIIYEDTGESEYLGEFYADDDWFDQPICKMARYLGIDCVFLTHMVGKTRIVGEIMDTRDRTESYGALKRINK